MSVENEIRYCLDANIFKKLGTQSILEIYLQPYYDKLSEVSLNVIILQIIFDEIQEDEELRKWIEDNMLQNRPVQINEDVQKESMTLMKQYQTEPTGKGASVLTSKFFHNFQAFNPGHFIKLFLY